MKKILCTLLPAALLAASCAREINESTVPTGSVTVTFNAEIASSRTHLLEDAGCWVPYWDEKDTLSVILTSDYSKPWSFVNQAQSGRTGTFTGTIEATDGEYTLIAHHPKKDGRAEHNFKFRIPGQQALPSLTTFDPEADLLVSEPAALSVEGGSADIDGMTFHRLLAPVRIILEDATTGSLLSERKVSGLTLTSSSSILTGRVTVNIDTREIVEWEAKNSQQSVSAVYAGNDWEIDGNCAAYLLVNPVTLPAGSSLALDVVTDQENLSVKHVATLTAALPLPLNEMTTLRFKIEDADVHELSGDAVTWNFSDSEWDAQFNAASSAKGSNQTGWSVSYGGLTYTEGSKNGKWDVDAKTGLRYIQPNGAGDKTMRVFSFNAARDGILTVSVVNPSAGTSRNVIAEYGTNGKSQKAIPDNGDVSIEVTKGKVYVYPDNGIRFFKFVFEPTGEADPEDPEEPEEPGETTLWDFSTSAWQTEFAKYGTNDTWIEPVNIQYAGLSIVMPKGKFRPDCWQAADAGNATDSYLKFTASADGVLKVKASHTGSSPDATAATRAVTVSNGGDTQSVVAGVPNNAPKTCSFEIVAGDVYIFSTVGALRFYTIEFVPGGSAGPENPDDPDTPADAEGELDCPDPPVEGNVELDRMYGYAQAAGVTGGEGATAANTLHFNSGKALQTWLLARAKAEKKGDSAPVIIWLSGTFGPSDGRDFSEAHPWFDVKEVSNISFYGTDGFVMDRIGMFLVRAKNIIIRNLNVNQPKANNGADAISIQDSDGVWVDHCTFTSLNQTKDYEDGSTDITHGSRNVTVSWCRYIKTQKSCLVGHSNSQSGDTQITVTFHHNWFDNSSSRHPRVRFGRAHVYNNLYDGCTTYGAGSAYGARVLVEYNYFDGVQLPTDICTYPAKEGDVSNLQGSVAGYLYATQDVYVNKPQNARSPYPLTNVRYTSYNGSTITPLTYADFKPAYDYIVTRAEDVPETVMAGAGYGKLGWSEAPLAVNNGGITDFNGSDDNPTDPDTGDEDDPETPDQPASGLAEGWNWINNGATASYALADGQLTISSTGKWESGAQTFGAVYRELSGDFTATVKLDSFVPQKSGNQGVAGLIVFVSDPSATAANLVYLLAGKGDKYYRRYRLGTSGDAAKSTGSAMSAPATTGSSEIFRIVREGNVLKASYSLDGGETFGDASTVDFSGTIGASVKVGIVCNSSDNSKQGTAVFSAFTLNGTQTAF